MEDLSKGFKFKSVYTTKGKDNTKKAYDNLVLNDKKIDDVLYKKVSNELSDGSKNIFQEAKKLVDLRVEIYKKLVLEEENSEFEESVGERVMLKNQRVNFPATPERKEFNNFLKQIKEEQKNIDIVWFKNEFNYEMPNKMLEYLHGLKRTEDCNQATSIIEESFTDFKDMVEDMSESDEKNKEIKILNIVDKILNFQGTKTKRTRLKNINPKPNA